MFYIIQSLYHFSFFVSFDSRVSDNGLILHFEVTRNFLNSLKIWIISNMIRDLKLLKVSTSCEPRVLIHFEWVDKILSIMFKVIQSIDNLLTFYLLSNWTIRLTSIHTSLQIAPRRRTIRCHGIVSHHFHSWWSL